MRLRPSLDLTFLFFASSVLFVVSACSDGSEARSEADGFISYIAGGVTDTRLDRGDDSAAPTGAESSDTSPAERAISEADIIQIDGDRLYALSSYSGLTIVDISNPSALRVEGTYRSSAVPFEMYLEGGVAYLLFNGFYTYAYDEAAGAYNWESSARVQALDVSNPAEITLLGDEQVGGVISDSRLVGDILYLVTFQNGWCWYCDAGASTRVSSFDLANPSALSSIDQLSFDAGDGSFGGRSIAVTSERIYVGGPAWGSTDGSTIQVVGISNPNGEMALGAEVSIAGHIENRWQMDEFDGYFRVISQSGGWNSGTPPIVETFMIENSATLTPLGRLEMTLPRPEDLRSVRFDGTRAYAITFERTDPLFTIDLSDHAAPVQRGELEIPGWIYHMEPRGDRLYGLGYDAAEEGRGMTVSVFDVSDMDTPTLLDRVVFGGSWAWAVEDQDRIHKAFNLMLDEGLIFVPFAGSDRDEASCHWEFASGIQIIDVIDDDLQLRGVAPQIGTARRSIYREGTLLGVSDNAITSFDLADRDAPKNLDTLDIARNISSLHVVGAHLLRFGNDWWI
ncbi:MAG: beta-propeller domain-containing protein [Myxococcota bacterium]